LLQVFLQVFWFGKHYLANKKWVNRELDFSVFFNQVLLVKYVFLFLIPLLFFSELSHSAGIGESCKYGYRNPLDIRWQTGNTSWCESAIASLNTLDDGYVYGAVCTDLGDGRSAMEGKKVLKEDCASRADDTEDKDGCYSSDMPNGVCPTKECTASNGTVFNLAIGKNCSDYDVSSTDPDGVPCNNCIVHDGGADGGSSDGNGGGETGGGETGGGETGGGETGGGETGGDGSSTSTDRDSNETSCGIGQIMGANGCGPMPDNCGYINGSYQCANPEPPSGCGTIQAPGELPIEDCFEEKKNCGWFGPSGQEKYSCLDVTGDPTCNGGIIINGVCDNDDHTPTSCPSGYSLVNGVCKDYNSCPIGSSMGLGGSCETDDCPSGKYMHMGQCLDIPEPPPKVTDTGGDTTPPTTDIDLSSVNNNLNKVNNNLSKINTSIKTADSNNTSKLNQVKTSVDKVGEKIDTASATNSEKLDAINDSINDINSCAEDGGLKDSILCKKTKVSLTNTALPTTLSEALTQFFNRLSNSPIASMFTGSFEIFNQDGQCPDLVFDLSDVFGSVIRSDAHCVLLEKIRSPLGILMILVFSIAGIRVIGTA